MTVRRGTYVLLITLGLDSDIRVGALGIIHFPAGTYCYVGSAMSGLDQRLRRHLTRDKTQRWHADYLVAAASDVRAMESYPDAVPECELARLPRSAAWSPGRPGSGAPTAAAPRTCSGRRTGR